MSWYGHTLAGAPGTPTERECPFSPSIKFSRQTKRTCARRKKGAQLNGYRIYFLNEQRGIIGAHRFLADDDETALWIAARLHDACSDACDGFELWYMARRVGRGDGAAWPVETCEAVNERRQRLLAEAEEALHHSASRIAASRRLLESLKRKQL